VATYSNHWIANSGFRAAIESFLREEDAYIDRYREQAESLLPYKQTDN
jgi:predicted N-acyltransferase